MTWIEKLKGFFAKPQAFPTETEASVAETPLPAVLPTVTEEIATDELPHWLTDEAALRDEGVLFGLTGTDPQEKLRIIEAAFKRRSAGYMKIREELSEKIGELNLILEKKDNLLSSTSEKSDSLANQQPEEENVLRVAIGLLLSVAMCAANYFLIKEGLRYGFPNDTGWIAWGVFLTGMFSMYYTTSLIHNQDRITWRRLTEEFGMPLAASLFVYVQVVSHVEWYRSLGYFLFTLFVFLISGKLLLGSIARLKSEAAAWRRNVQLRENKKDPALSLQKTSLETDMERIRVDKWKIVAILNDAETEITRLSAEKDAAINLFMSEYNLAKKHRESISNKQLSNIIAK